jgi:transposase
MARPAVISVEDKFRLVLSVVSGELRRQFLEGGKQGLADGGRPGSSPQVQRLEDVVEDLKTALGEAHVELRAWKKSAEGRLGPTRSSR